MKKIFLVSCYILATVAMTSCTNDDLETTPNGSKQHEIVYAIDGDSGQTTLPKPK